MLLVASETGHVYTFATRKLQPMITSEAGKALIQTCLNSPDPEDPGSGDQRMSVAGFEETEFCYGAEDQLKVRPPPSHPTGYGEYSGVMGRSSGYGDQGGGKSVLVVSSLRHPPVRRGWYSGKSSKLPVS